MRFLVFAEARPRARKTVTQIICSVYGRVGVAGGGRARGPRWGYCREAEEGRPSAPRPRLVPSGYQPKAQRSVGGWLRIAKCRCRTRPSIADERPLDSWATGYFIKGFGGSPLQRSARGSIRRREFGHGARSRSKGRRMAAWKAPPRASRGKGHLSGVHLIVANAKVLEVSNRLRRSAFRPA